MKYYITEHATYEVEADSPKSARQIFLNGIQAPFPTEVISREIYDANDNDMTEEAQDEN